MHLYAGIILTIPAFGGWGGFTDKERDQFGPTFGSVLKVGASSMLCVASKFTLR